MYVNCKHAIKIWFCMLTVNMLQKLGFRVLERCSGEGQFLLKNCIRSRHDNLCIPSPQNHSINFPIRKILQSASDECRGRENYFQVLKI